jgi:tetraacyldisaccharide 4'-kinase
VKTRLATYWRELAGGRRSDPLSRLLLVILMPPSLAYALMQFLRVSLYRAGVLNSRRLPRPVISVGNITVGGTGKTPVSALIARLIMEKGLRVAILSRGYGGSLEGETAVVCDGTHIFLTARECGDEPLLLARTIPGVLVVIGSDRYAAGRLAMKRLNPDIFLLDDGYQHLRLHRDLNILLLDYTLPFGNGWCMPGGMLREPVSAARRADLVIRTRCPVDAHAGAVVPGRPHCCARHLLGGASPQTGGTALPLTALCGRKMLAFAGIAEPGLFFEGLREQGLDLIATLEFPDHAEYGQTEFAKISAAIKGSAAEFVLTTEKDGVKLFAAPMEISEKILLVRLELALDDPAPLAAALRNLLQK